MNFLVFNKSAQNLKTAIYGQHDTDLVAVATDEDGNFIFSPASQITVTASSLDIRNLSAARDSVQVGAKGFAEARATLNVGSNTTTYLLARDIGPYSQNSYFLRNTSALGSITVSVETAPVDDGSYYMGTATTAVGANGNYLASVATLIRYARLRVQMGGNAINVDAFYNGRA